MSNRGAIIRFYASALIVALFLTCVSIKSINYNAQLTPVTSPFILNTIAPQNTPVQNVATQDENTISQDTTSPIDNTTSETVSATGTVAGKVIEKFISPYTANTSYNNVYLKNNTDLNINLKDFINAELNLKIEKGSAPQVLILHTHATESYLLHNENYYTENDTSRNTNNAYNMIALGKIISDRLNAAGITTLHDTTQHDNPSYNESYSRAANTICKYVEKYPSIKIVIDLHRDALSENDTDKVKLTTEIEGKKAAQIMLVMGSQSGNVKNFPNWEENLKLAVRLQQTLESMYPSLARSIHFMSKNYNQSLTNGSMLIEIGTDGNTLAEAKYSAELLSDALTTLLSTLS